jgi:fluoride ion exporter CrcB/FEX
MAQFVLFFPAGSFIVNIAGLFPDRPYFRRSEKGGSLLTPEWRIALTNWAFAEAFTTVMHLCQFENMNLVRTGAYLYLGLYIFL